MKSPLISVIVPVYNTESFLPRCLKSLSAQTYKNLEIILIDDGSTDSSGRLCDNFIKKSKLYKVFHTKNHGLSAARNLGLKHATGEYVTFVDSDDEILPDYVEFLYKLCKVNNTKMSICAVHEIRTTGKVVNSTRGPAADEPDSPTSAVAGSTRVVAEDESGTGTRGGATGGTPDARSRETSTVGESVATGPRSDTEDPRSALHSMLLDRGFTCTAYAKLYHKSLWQGITFPVGKLHEDLGTTYKLIMRCDKIAIDLSPKYIYHKHPNSLSTSAFSKQKLDIITLTDKMCHDIQTAYPDDFTLRRTCRIRRIHARLSVLKSFLNIGAYLASHRQP